MGGEIERVLERAARDPAFLSLLLDDRESAVASLDVSESVKNVLLAADAQHLKKMVWEVRDRLTGAKSRPIVRRSFLYVGGIAAAATVGAAVLVPATTGIAPDLVHARAAQRYLKNIALAQWTYREKHGRHATLAELVEGDLIEPLDPGFPYSVAIVVDGESFTATARHKTRPDTRPAFVVGVDGVVRELERGDE